MIAVLAISFSKPALSQCHLSQCLNVTGSFNPISPTPSLAAQIVPKLTWATQGKERNGYDESTELQLIPTLGFPPFLPLLSVCALLQLSFCTQARNDLGGSVQAVSLTVVSNSA